MKRKIKQFISITLMLCLVASLFTSIDAYAATVKINNKVLTLYVSETSTLKISGTKNAVKWTSSKKEVATVSSKGKVTAKKAGNATITATANKEIYTCKVTVKESFNAKTAVKNINSDLLNIGDGVVAIIENNYTFPVSLSATMVFYDKDGSMLGKSSNYNYYFESGKKCALHFNGPYDSDYKDVEYDSYKISYSVDELTSTIKSNLSDKKIESNFGADNVMVQVTNNGKVENYSTQVGIVFYRGGNAVGYDYQYTDSNGSGATSYLEFSFPHDSNYDTIPVDNYEIFINNSYYYTWQ